jgi:hypothetical protein
VQSPIPTQRAATHLRTHLMDDGGRDMTLIEGAGEACVGQ